MQAIKEGRKPAKVNRDNCKFGATEDLRRRWKDYCRTFKEKNIKFFSYVVILQFKKIEDELKAELSHHRVPGQNGRYTEWLKEIDPNEVVEKMLDVTKRRRT